MLLLWSCQDQPAPRVGPVLEGQPKANHGHGRTNIKWIERVDGRSDGSVPSDQNGGEQHDLGA